MGESILKGARTSRLAAAAITVIVAAGLVAAPVAPEPARLQPVVAMQLHTDAIELTAASLPAATEQPNILVQLQGVVLVVGYTAALVALTPVWYAAAPITIPVSVALATLFLGGLSLLGGDWQKLGPIDSLKLGLYGWAVGPPFVLGETLKVAGRYIKSLVPPPKPATDPPSASRTVGQDRQPTRGVAGSRRAITPNAAPAPTTHRSAKSTSKTTAKSQAGATGSGRGVGKTARR